MENNLNVWQDVLGGFIIVLGMVLLIKTIYGVYVYRNSIYTAIYSNYIEYLLRRKSIKRLSESYYFKSRFGVHRIFYQVASNKSERTPQAYVLTILTSGLYIANIKTQGGKVLAKVKGDFKNIVIDKAKKGQKPEKRVFTIKNPLDEVLYFQNRIEEKLKSFNIPIHRLVVFPDQANIIWEDENQRDEIVLQRKELFDTINKIHEKSSDIISENQIDAIYMTLAAEALEMEKRK